LFIAIEGIDGSGKSTQSVKLVENLTALGYAVHGTCQPTGRPIGKLIRQILRKEWEAQEETIAGLFVADRLDHITNTEDGLLKHLAEGEIVVTDRYYFSSYAYHGTHIDMQWVIAANAMCARMLRPTLNIFIDVTPEVAIERIKKNRTTIDLYETLDNLTNVRSQYLKAFEQLKGEERICIIDGNQDMEVVAQNVLAQVRSLIK
jgi:dTMP kinase